MYRTLSSISREDADTEVILLYLEGVRDGRRLFDIIKKTTEKKPVLVLTVGEGDIAEFARSHTGNMIGSYEVKVAALKQAGAVVVSSGDDLVDAANLFCRVRLKPSANPGVGILTGQAGPGMVIADRLRRSGVSLPELDASTIAKIQQELPPMSFIRNPVDTTRPSATFPNVLRAMALNTSIDLIATFLIYEPAVVDPVTLFKGLSDITKPLIFGTAGYPEYIYPAIAALSGLNIAAFPSPDRTAKAIIALVEDAKAAFRKSISVPD